MLKNKSQMEIMGLVIIIILIAIGMLFAVQFMLRVPAGKPTTAVKESILAANFLNTMLSTTTECLDRNMRDLFQDCALTSGALTCPGGYSSCEYAATQVQLMLDNTLGRWQKDYYFTIAGSYDVEQIQIGMPCPGEREAKVHPVPVRPGFDIQFTLEICG